MFSWFLIVVVFEILCNGKIFDRWPYKVRKWPLFLANVAVNACQGLASLQRSAAVAVAGKQLMISRLDTI
jgi:hypothetical protein